MNPVIADVLDGVNPKQGAYDSLPKAIKQYYTPVQWSFLSDFEKGNCVRDNTEPEC